MTDLLALTGHWLHLLVVLGGLAGTAAMFAPRVADRVGLLRAPDSPLDRRVADLRESALAGTLASAPVGLLVPRVVPGEARPPGEPVLDDPVPDDPLLGAAVVGSAAAAGVHAAVGPMHLADYPLLALGFLVTAVLQGAWPLVALAGGLTPVAPGPGATDRIAAAGALLQGTCLTIWAVSRTVGLPAFVHGPGAQAAGPWDLAAVAWQLVALAWCLAHLAGRRHRAAAGAIRPGWGTRGARVFLGGSAVALVLLTLSGASA